MIVLVALPVGLLVGAAIGYASRSRPIAHPQQIETRPAESRGHVVSQKPTQVRASGPTSSLYVTKQEDIVVPEFVRVGDEMQTVTPLLDRSTGGFAQLNYEGALEAARRNSASLISKAGVEKRSDIARSKGTELSPVTLPDGGMMKAAGVDTSDRKAIGAFLNSRMRSAEWMKIHDDRVREQLKAIKWDGKTVVSNIGKPWTSGAPDGKASLFGWRLPNGSWIQQENREHDRQWSDYGTKTILRRAMS